MTKTPELSKLCGAQIQRQTSLSCARMCKRYGDMKDMRHFLRSARRWHAKALRIIPTVPRDQLQHFFGGFIDGGAA